MLITHALDKVIEMNTTTDKPAIESDNQRTHVVIPRELINEVDDLVGPRRRSQFLADALREKLNRVRLASAAREAAGSLADVPIPQWQSSAGAAAWVRKLRRSDDLRNSGRR